MGEQKEKKGVLLMCDIDNILFLITLFLVT